MPTPWVSDGPHSPGTIDITRASDSIALMLCVVCGLGFAENERAHIAAAQVCAKCPEPWYEGQAQCGGCGSTDTELGVVYDHGLTHEQCAVMTVSFCPSFRESVSGHPIMTMWSLSTLEAQSIMQKLGGVTIQRVRLCEHLDSDSVQIRGAR